MASTREKLLINASPWATASRMLRRDNRRRWAVAVVVDVRTADAASASLARAFSSFFKPSLFRYSVPDGSQQQSRQDPLASRPASGGTSTRRRSVITNLRPPRRLCRRTHAPTASRPAFAPGDVVEPPFRPHPLLAPLHEPLGRPVVFVVEPQPPLTAFTPRRDTTVDGERRDPVVESRRRSRYFLSRGSFGRCYIVTNGRRRHRRRPRRRRRRRFTRRRPRSLFCMHDLDLSSACTSGSSDVEAPPPRRR